MNRTDRLLALVLELQAKGWQRAEDLAATFEVSKRTIYRDMLALAESGVPVVSNPGQGYSLVEGYFLPPVSFSTDEAVTLLLGADYMAGHFDAQYQVAAQNAGRKIEAVLGDSLRAEVQGLRGRFMFVLPSHPDTPGLRERLAMVRRAIIERKTLRFDYHARAGESEATLSSTRDIDPFGLLHFERYWFVFAYCHLRQDKRRFRLDRMENIEVTSRIFPVKPDYVIEEDQTDNRTLTVRVVFSHEVVRWMQEDRSFYIVAEASHPDGLLVTLQVRSEGEIYRWLLSWGEHVRVLEPESLRERLLAEAGRMVANYQFENA